MLKLIYILLFYYLLNACSVNSQVTGVDNPKLSILCIAAHPDDEDGATLAYYSKLKGVNAYTVIYTRGEGGQNEIGPELYDELGKIREKETNEAAEIQGSKVYFLGFLDFGFSKTAKETFKMWGGEDNVLARIVYMIRTIKPDVIITNHDTITTKPDRQHGNHQAVGITVYEAFEKAADPNYFPEQLNKSIQPWQVKKLFFRTFDSTKIEGIVNIDINQTDASGKTIGEISREALAKHRTQGMDKTAYTNSLGGVFRARRYELIRSDKEYSFDSNDLFSGLTPVNKFTLPVNSFTTRYSYNILSKEDSLKILSQLKFDKYKHKIGLIKTYDKTIENFLSGLSIKFELIDSLMLANYPISKYDVIILDLRTYLYRTDVLRYNNSIIRYIKDGGNVVCFYNKPTDWNIGTELAPYPIFITNERVTEEDAPVTILHPEHRYFNEPNKINSDDWDNWIQERNIYLPSDDTTKTSSKYERLLAMQDEDDPVPSTSLLWTEFGKGTYTYCSLALYRQLKIFNKGGVKLFLNLISQKHRVQKGTENIK